MKDMLLDYYHCTFFLPLAGLSEDLIPEGDPWLYNEKTRDEDAAQAWLYISATRRDILFQKDLEQKDLKLGKHPRPIQEWRLPLDEVERLQLHLGKKKHAPEKAENDEEKAACALHYQIAQMTSVRLYRYFNGIYLLAFTLRPARLEALRQAQEKLYEKRLSELKEAYRKTHEQAAKGESLEGLEKDAREWLTDHNYGVPLFREECPATLGEARDRYGAKADGYEQLQLEAWLRFTRLARQLYPSFAEQSEEGKLSPLRLWQTDEDAGVSTLLAEDFTGKLEPRIPADPGALLSDTVQVLLKKFFSESRHGELEKSLKNDAENGVKFDDDRMFVSVAYGLVDKCLSAEERERLFSLVLYVDRLEDAWLDGWAYSADFVKQQMRGQVLKRWAASGLLYGYTDYSNAALSSGSFFREILAPRHILPIYDRMLVQALFYRESLRRYDAQICTQTGLIVDQDKLDHMQARHQDFIRFTNQYWFHDLTEQMQGKEIFRLQQEALGLKGHYDIIKDELERTDEFLQVRYEIKLGRWGWLVALLAIYYTLLPMVNGMLAAGEGEETLWSRVGGLLCIGEWGGLILLLIVLPFVIFLLFKFSWKFSWGRKDLKQ